MLKAIFPPLGSNVEFFWSVGYLPWRYRSTMVCPGWLAVYVTELLSVGCGTTAGGYEVWVGGGLLSASQNRLSEISNRFDPLRPHSTCLCHEPCGPLAGVYMNDD